MDDQGQKNYTPFLVGGISLVLILGVLGYFFLSANTNKKEEKAPISSIQNENGNLATSSSETQNTSSGYKGALLAGRASPLLDSEKSDYEKALKTDKLIVLYFYANWCPTCREEFPKMKKAFDELENENVIGFRVNFNDNETEDHEKDLASEFGVAYQHTKVFVKNGERVLKSPESWEKDRYISEIQKEI